MTLSYDMPMDVAKNHRQQARPNTDSYVKIQTLPPIAITLVPQRLVMSPTPCFLAMLQATLSNVGIVYVGGPNVTALAGMELDGGRGLLLSTDFNPIQAQLGSSGFSATRNLLDAGSPKSYMLIDLYEVWVMGSVIDQTLRVMYMVPVR